MDEIIKHYDKLIDENNDPVFDAPVLKEYMDGYDGSRFIDEMQLNNDKSVLEIGCGTGRLAVRVCPLVKNYTGIDISPKTVERAKSNLKNFNNASVVLGDFLAYDFAQKYAVVFSSLTFFHIKDKRKAIEKAYGVLDDGGLFVLSIDNDKRQLLDYGTRTITLYPDDSDEINKYLLCCGFKSVKSWKSERATVFVARK